MSQEEAMQFAIQELKRADHSIAVSLKYTRTVDVIKSIVERLIGTVSFSLDVLLFHAKSEKKIAEVPKLPRTKIEIAKQLYPEDKNVADICAFFLVLRKIDKAKFERTQEYRRHVTMTAHLDGGEKVEITIDIISDYFDRTKEFLNYVSRLVSGESE